MDQSLPNATPVTETPSKGGNYKAPLLILLAVLIIGAAGVGAVTTMRNQSNTSPQSVTPTPGGTTGIVDGGTIVFASWSSDKSLVQSYDIGTGKQQLVADLPKNIKKITVLSPKELLYINNVNVRDHGQEIVRYSIETREAKTILKAESGFGIDDYVLSPDRKFISTWEVQLNPTTTTLSGGLSRVYTAQVTIPTTKNLIYDESATDGKPVHYPRAILDDGRVYMDSFLPNVDAGWASGMSVSDFEGKTVQDLASMQNGTYGTQPELSPDGKFLAFAGYNADGGTGISEARGFRRAILTANTVEVLDLVNNVRQPLSGLSAENTYTAVGWDKTGQNILFSQVSKNASENGTFVYDRASSQVTKYEQDQAVVSSLPNSNKVLVGNQLVSQSYVANLGDAYSYPYTSLAVYDPESKNVKPLSVKSGDMQFITVEIPSYFETASNSASYDNERLQLYTFNFKPTLGPMRIDTNSTPRCRDLAAEICNEQLGTNFSVDANQIRLGSQGSGGTSGPTTDANFNSCWTQQFAALKGARDGSCNDSPLYLYGKKGTKVKVSVHTPVHNSIPAYENGYNVILGENGKFSVGGKDFSSIIYDYTPALRRFDAPTKGYVVSQKNLDSAFKKLADNLKLNQKETDDLVEYGRSVVTSPYAFVSFLNEDISKAMLPMSFSPKVDTYINIVFYVRLLDVPFSVAPPVYPQVPNRTGTTAVEISGIVE